MEDVALARFSIYNLFSHSHGTLQCNTQRKPIAIEAALQDWLLVFSLTLPGLSARAKLAMLSIIRAIAREDEPKNAPQRRH